MVLHRNDIPKKEYLSLRMIKAKSAAILPFKINVSISKERYVTFAISILFIVSVRACKFWYESNYFAKLRDIFFQSYQLYVQKVKYAATIFMISYAVFSVKYSISQADLINFRDNIVKGTR